MRKMTAVVSMMTAFALMAAPVYAAEAESAVSEAEAVVSEAEAAVSEAEAAVSEAAAAVSEAAASEEAAPLCQNQNSSLKPLPGLKVGIFLAGISIASPVEGLRPTRAARSLTSNTPKPII